MIDFYRPRALLEPTTATLLIAGLALSAAGTGATIYAQQEAASAQKDAANYDAQVAANNALQAQQASDYEATRIRDKNRRLLASSVAATAKNGIQLSGSSQDVLYDSSVQGELDAMAALYTGKVSANAQEAQARLSRMKSASIGASQGINAAGTALGGVGSGLAQYGSFKARKAIS